MVNVNGTFSPSGKYDCLVDKLCNQAMVPILVPPGTAFLIKQSQDIISFSGLVIGQHDNDQILAITHEQKGIYHYNILHYLTKP